MSPRGLQLGGALVALALGACGGPNGSSAQVLEGSPPSLEGARVAVAITPGKPSAPTETVEVAWAPGGALLRVERRQPGGVATSAEAPLSGAELEALWRVVEEHGLASFVPVTREGTVFDFGERALTLAPGGDEPVHSVTWTEPLVDEEPFRALAAHLGRLARSHASEVELHYFPSSSSE